MTAAQKNELLKGLMSLLSVADAPAAKGKGRRTLSDEQKAKMAEGRRKAAAAKGKVEAKVAAAAKSDREEFAGGMSFGEGSVGKRSRKVSVPFYVEGQYAGSIRADLARKVFLAIRGAAAGDMLAHIELQGEQA